MKEMKVKLTNEDGMHGRAAANFVRVASRFNSDIKIALGDISVNGKSIIGIMSLGAFRGEELTVKANGSDENVALRTLVELINDEFQIK